MPSRSACASVLAVMLLAGACRRTLSKAPPADPYAQDWAIDPAAPGPDLPPAGRSLFDALVPDPAPFPFPKLLAQVESNLGGAVRYRRVLIPLGRSLQRSSAAPDFFLYPRAVAAFDAEPSSNTAPVKDRLFLGYQEKAGVIEVISYNEQAGRFEFQLVKGYRAGDTPRVYYARRTVCTACHQNQAPIFPRQLWDETNSNYRVASLLLASERSFYGFPVPQSADVPYQIDNAVHRANEFSIYQLIWMRANLQVRRAWLAEMLRCRLSGSCESPDLAAAIARQWQEKWPRGLRVSNPEIRNRNPLAILSREGPKGNAEILAFLANRQKNIGPLFEPAIRREPLDLWRGDPEHVQRVVAGLAAFFPERHVRELDAALSRLPAPSIEYRAACTAEQIPRGRIKLRCDPERKSPPGFSFEAILSNGDGSVHGSVRMLAAGASAAVSGLEAAGRMTVSVDGAHGAITLVRSAEGLSARCGDGNRIERIVLMGREAVLVARADFDLLDAAISRLARNTESGDSDVLSTKPFRESIARQQVLEELQVPFRPLCCQLPDGRIRKPKIESD